MVREQLMFDVIVIARYAPDGVRQLAMLRSAKAQGGDVRFALDESRSLAVFAGLWTNRR
jgi:hypothetical protein